MTTNPPAGATAGRAARLLRDPSHGAGWIGGGAVVAGFVVLLLGWRGAAATLLVHAQVAFAVSGGVVGLALVGTGLGLVRTHAERLSDAVEARAWRRLAAEWTALAAARRGRA